MPEPLTAEQWKRRAQIELNKAEDAHNETVILGRASDRTTRLRAAMGRARRNLRQAMRRGLPEIEARKIYESGAPDPEFGAPEW